MARRWRKPPGRQATPRARTAGGQYAAAAPNIDRPAASVAPMASAVATAPAPPARPRPVAPRPAAPMPEVRIPAPVAGTPSPGRIEQGAASVERIATAADKVSSSTTRAAGAVTTVSTAVEAVGKVGIGTFAAVTAAIGATAYATVQLSKLLSTITGIPLPIVAAGMTVIGAAAIYAFVPAAALTATFGAVSAACGVLAATAGTAAAGLWAIVAPAVALAAPFVLIAAAAYSVYKVLFDWQSIPGWLRAILLVTNPIAAGLRLVANAFSLAWSAAKLFVSAIALPFTAAVGTVRLMYAAVMLIPGAVVGAVRAIPAVVSAAGSAIQSTASAAWTAAKWMASEAIALGRSAAAAIGTGTAFVVSLPGRGFDVIQSGLRGVADLAGRAGGAMQGLAGRITGPMASAAAAFAVYGVELDRIQRKHEIGADSAAVYALASRATGKSIADLIAVMPQGSAEFARWSQEAGSLGLTMGGPGVASAMALSQAFQRSKEAVAGFWSQVGSAVAPIITDTTQTIVGAIQAATKWAKENQPLIVSLFKWASAVGTVGTALVFLGTGLGTVATFLGPIVAGLAAGGLALTAWRTGLAGDIWGRFGSDIQSAYATVVDYGWRIIGFAQKVSGGVVDAIKAGNLEMAVKIAWTGARVAWEEGFTWLAARSGGAFSGILSNLAAGQWSDAAEGAMNAVRIAWSSGLETLDGWLVKLEGQWAPIANAADEAFTAAVNSADGAFVAMQNAADPWWLAISKGWRSAVGEVTVWVSATVAGVQTLAGTVATFGEAFGNIIMAPFRLLPGATAAAKIALESMIAPIAQLRKFSGLGTAELVEANKPKPAAAQAGAVAQAAIPLKPGQKPGEPEEDFLVRVRRERRESDLSFRQGERITDSGDRGGVRNAAQMERADAFAARQVEREQQIATLKERQAELTASGQTAAAAKLEADRKALEDQLALAKAAREEAEKNRPDVAGLVGKVEDYEAPGKGGKGLSSGTFSGYAIGQMFGGDQGVAEKQLAAQLAIAANTADFRAGLAEFKLSMGP